MTFYAAMMLLELMSFLALRYREPELERPFCVPGGWFVAVLLCTLPCACIGAGIWIRLKEHDLFEVIVRPLMVMATGPMLYPLAAAHHRRLKRRLETARATLVPAEKCEPEDPEGGANVLASAPPAPMK